ncbi:phage integrase N-terminal SAM-like domain-containing protein [Flavobacterium sp. CS20]|uniref:phage integrase N-terminal SAM-like domain-containing protein n=1 Tax=Flavobacterium sp. CS20 TaxID=2775246 RepID=UPI001B3A5C7B|nr:phage integrase N-terminal SAM-like domain-containing protein [Flavobacterium sp. CS20]QTY27590.1 phage integrase N-terminal SAM-like domain-containing protein [Flavobacterium sp. CS20]
MKLKEYLQQEYSPTSINSYELMINRYILAMGDKAEKGTYTDVLDYIGLLREQNLHPKSLRNNLFAIKIYYRYLVVRKTQRPPLQIFIPERPNKPGHPSRKPLPQRNIRRTLRKPPKQKPGQSEQG